MSLKETRNEFLRKSGRYDLGSIDGEDNGANFYINSGQRMLDRRMANEQLRAKRIGKLEVGQYIKIFPQAKVISNVWLINDTTGDIITLDRKTYQQIRDFYAQSFNVMDNSTPAYWCPAYVRLDPNLTIDEVPFEIDKMDEYVLGGYKSNGIIFSPPTDTEYRIDVLGKFYTANLTNDGDKSIWTESYPNVLLYAALYQLEVTHRNSEGARDWLAAIDNELIGMDMDSVEFDTEHISQMGG